MDWWPLNCRSQATVGAPLLRFVQEPALSLPKGAVGVQAGGHGKTMVSAASYPPSHKTRERGTRCFRTGMRNKT